MKRGVTQNGSVKDVIREESGRVCVHVLYKMFLIAGEVKESLMIVWPRPVTGWSDTVVYPVLAVVPW